MSTRRTAADRVTSTRSATTPRSVVNLLTYLLSYLLTQVRQRSS